MATRITRTLRHLASATTDRGRRMIGPRLSELGSRASGLALRWRDDLRENPAGRIVVQLMDDLVQRLRHYARQLDAGADAGSETRRSRGSGRDSDPASRPARSRQAGRGAIASPSGHSTTSQSKGGAARRPRAGGVTDTTTGTHGSSTATTGARASRDRSTAGKEGARAATRRESEDSAGAPRTRKGASKPTANSGSTRSASKRKASTGSASPTPPRSRTRPRTT